MDGTKFLRLKFILASLCSILACDGPNSYSPCTYSPACYLCTRAPVSEYVIGKKVAEASLRVDSIPTGSSADVTPGSLVTLQSTAELGDTLLAYSATNGNTFVSIAVQEYDGWVVAGVPWPLTTIIESAKGDNVSCEEFWRAQIRKDCPCPGQTSNSD